MHTGLQLNNRQRGLGSDAIGASKARQQRQTQACNYSIHEISNESLLTAIKNRADKNKKRQDIILPF
jgi:hypothetical protein